MSIGLIQSSFAAGEISPNLYARVDLAKWHIGAALIRNFIVDYRGGVTSRPGTLFVGKSKQAYGNGAPRLISFQFSQTQTYVLEFGNNYIRFITSGGYILETSDNIVGITQANPGIITSGDSYANGDWLFVQGILGMTQLNGKTGVVTGLSGDDFSLTDLWGVPIDTTNYSAYVSGGTVSRYYTIASPYAIADIQSLKFVQSTDVLTITHPSYPTYNLSRTGQTNWSLSVVTFGSQQVSPVAVSATASNTTPTPLAQFSYVITAVNNVTGEESVASNIVGCQSVDIGQTAGSITTIWSAAVGAGVYKIYKAGVGYNTTTTPIGSLFGYIGSTTGLSFIDGNINPDFTQVPPTHNDPFAEGQIDSATVTASGSGYTSQPTFTITTAAGTGAVLQAVVIGGAINAINIINGGSGYLPGDTVAISGGGGSSATATLNVGPATNIFPSVSSYFQQRQYFGNTNDAPDTFWASQTGNYSNMDASTPPRDTDAITDTLSAQQVNGIQAMVSMPTGLVMLTGLGAWQLTGGGAGTAVTPSNAVASAQAYNGCSPVVPPIVINYDILYVQEKGSIVRDLSYNFFVNIYTGTDLTVISNHLFLGYKILQWAWAEEPFKLIAAVRDDGTLLTLTYLKEQEVYGWAHSDTYGLYCSICSISEPPVNALYVVVQRFLNNQWVYYVERFDNRIWNGVEDVWAVDAGLQTVPNATPNATLTISAPTGSVTCTASTAVFNSGMVGNIIRASGGIMTITGYTSSTVVTANITQTPTAVLQDSYTNVQVVVPAVSGTWTVWTPVTSVGGLDHLDGATVSVLADGSVQASRTVVNGAITLYNQPVSKVTVGLGFQAQLQSLYVDKGDPTIQGKRKLISALTARVANTRGIKMGTTFNTVVEYKQRGASIFAGTPIPLFTGDQRLTLDASWNVPGQICIQQDYPLPVSVLGIIPEITVGDDNG